MLSGRETTLTRFRVGSRRSRLSNAVLPRPEAQLKILTEAEVGWLAGLFEGEGCISMDKLGKARAQLCSTDRDVIEKFARIVRVGCIHPQARKESRELPQRRPIWTWGVYEQGAVRYFIELLLPHLGERRSQRAREALAAIDAYEQSRQRFCVHCGKPFLASKAALQWYCERTCTIKAQEQKRKARLRAKRLDAV